MGVIVQDSWANAVAHEVGRGISIEADSTGWVLKLPCQTCQISKQMRLTTRLPPVVVRRKLTEKGWRVGGRLICDSCVRTRPAANGRPPVTDAEPVAATARPLSKPIPTAKPATKQGESMASTEQPTKIETFAELNKLVNIELSPDQKLAHRNAMRLLEDVFDDLSGCYIKDEEGPWSDERIARTTGYSVENVRINRERYFGKLRGPAEFTELEAELQKYNQRLEQIKQDAAAAVGQYEQKAKALQADYENLQRSFKATLTQLHTEASSLNEKFNLARQRNGWKA